MEENKIIEMNDEVIEVAEGFVEDCGGAKLGKVLLTTGLIALAGFVTYKIVKVVKEKKAAQKALPTNESIEVEHTEIVDDESEEI